MIKVWYPSTAKFPKINYGSTVFLNIIKRALLGKNEYDCDNDQISWEYTNYYRNRNLWKDPYYRYRFMREFYRNYFYQSYYGAMEEK